jgi:ribosomal protein S18 acetylase RimI-like enzyme
MLRPTTPADLDAVITLGHREEISWFGEGDCSRGEIAAFLDSLDFASGEVFEAGGSIRGFALVELGSRGVLFLDPADPEPPYELLVRRLVERGATSLQVSTRDTRGISWLEANGWTHVRSAFDLSRDTAPLPAPMWPPGVEVAPFRPGVEDEEIHSFVYRDAAWAAVPGHAERTLAEWLSVHAASSRGWVARRRGRAVGWVAGELYADGPGCVSQIAVATGERGAGLGRALLVHSLEDLRRAGATVLWLGVMAENERALGLYRSVGLEVVKEWRTYELISEPAGERRAGS